MHGATLTDDELAAVTGALPPRLHSQDFARAMAVKQSTFKHLVFWSRRRGAGRAGDFPPPDGYERYRVRDANGRVLSVQGPYWERATVARYLSNRHNLAATNLLKAIRGEPETAGV